MAARWNAKSPAVRRILQEIRELQQEESTDFIAEAMEDDIFEFAFAVRGPPDTEFEGGIYHGRILLPPEYPFKPPSFMMLTPSGRFKTDVKICLSISSHHPEHWQPSWSVRTALTALIAFMPSPGAGALGSLDYTKEERQQLAAKSRQAPPKVTSAARQRVLDELHARMLELDAKARVAATAAAAEGGADGVVNEAPGEALARLRAEVEAAHGAGGSVGSSNSESSSCASGSGGAVGPSQSDAADAPPQRQSSRHDQSRPAGAGEGAPMHKKGGDQLDAAGWDAAGNVDQQAVGSQRRRVAASPPGPHAAAPPPPRQAAPSAGAAAAAARRAEQLRLQQQAVAADRGLTLLAVLLSVAIAVMLLKKIAVALGAGSRVDAFLHSA